MKPMHILFIPSFYADPEKPVCGVFFKDQAYALKKSGVKIAIAYVEPRRLHALNLHRIRDNHFQITFGEEDGLPTLRLHGWNPFMNTNVGGLVWSFLAQFLIDTYVARFGLPDLIHAHNSLWAGHAVVRSSVKHGIPYVITEHSTAFPQKNISNFTKKHVDRVFSGAKAIICVSDGLAKYVRPFCKNRKITIVPNVVHTDYFTMPPERPQAAPFVFLSIAHLVERKGVHILIEAFANRFRGNPNVRLEIGGDGPYRHQLEKLCFNLKVEDRITFLGALSRAEVRAAMWRARCFVLASFFETFGVVLIEAMSTGLPVIGTRCGGPEFIITPETGLLVQPGNAKELGGAMQSMVNHELFSSQLIRSYVVDSFSDNSFSNKLIRIYSDILHS